MSTPRIVILLAMSCSSFALHSDTSKPIIEEILGEIGIDRGSALFRDRRDENGYTSFYRQTLTGTPFLQPLFYVYPEDSNTFGNELQKV
jgi:N-acetyl-gamma-glutamylphosphate reductase